MIVNFRFNLSTSSIIWHSPPIKARVNFTLCTFVWKDFTVMSMFFILNIKEPEKKKNENTNDMLRNFNSLLLVTLIIILRSSVISVTCKHQHRPSCNSCLTFVYVTSAEHHIVHESHTYILIKKKKVLYFLTTAIDLTLNGSCSFSFTALA